MMDKRFTPSYSYRAPRENAAGKPVGRALDFVFAAGWWFFFTELGHVLITVLAKGCYCDFSLPEAPCSGVYMVMFEIAVTLALSVPPFMYFFAACSSKKWDSAKNADLAVLSRYRFADFMAAAAA